MRKFIAALFVTASLVGFATPASAGGANTAPAKECVAQAEAREMVRINPKLDVTSLRLCDVTTGVSASVAASVSAGVSVGAQVVSGATSAVTALVEMVLRILCLRP